MGRQSFKDVSMVACGTMSPEINFLMKENFLDPTILIKDIITEQGMGVSRVNASHCMGMLASDEEMQRITEEMAGGEPVWFMTPSWVKYRAQVFKSWDNGIANENFPRHTL
jgi:Protein of unknown function (DUF1638)